MNLLYPCGQEIPENTVAALRFIGKTGFLSRDTWERFFGTGKPRWRRRHIECLVKRGYLRPHANSEARGTFVLGQRGIALLDEQHWSRVSPAPVSQLGHDRAVGHALLALERDGLIHSWFTERELIRDRDRRYLVQKKDRIAKYPDAIFKMEAFGRGMTVALEYEATRKASVRYKAILRAYTGMQDLSMVLFICRSDTTQKAIQGCLKAFGGTPLVGRIAFADANEWSHSPSHAAITLRNGTVRLGEICPRKDRCPKHEGWPTG